MAERVKALGARLANLAGDVQQQLISAQRLIEPDAVWRVERAIVKLFDEAGSGIGVGFMVSAQTALTCLHHLSGSDCIDGTVTQSDGGQAIEHFRLARGDEVLDLAVLEASSPAAYWLDLVTEVPRELRGTRWALCALQLALQHQLPAEFPPGVGVLAVRSLIKTMQYSG